MNGVDHCGALFINMFYKVHDTCILSSVAADGNPIVARPNSAIPDHVVLELDELIQSWGKCGGCCHIHQRKACSSRIHTLFFPKNTEESLLDKLRSLAATYTFRDRVRELQDWEFRGRIAVYLLWEELIFLPVIARPYANHSIGLDIIFPQHLAKKKLC